MVTTGNLGFLFQSQAGEADLELQERYGSVIRLHATLGVGDLFNMLAIYC